MLYAQLRLVVVVSVTAGGSWQVDSTPGCQAESEAGPVPYSVLSTTPQATGKGAPTVGRVGRVAGGQTQLFLSFLVSLLLLSC